MSFGHYTLSTLGWIAAAMLAVWLVSLAMRNASIVDIFWGLGFVLIADLGTRTDGYAIRQALVGILAAAWGVRLALHLFIRNRGTGEDARYVAMRRRWGSSFWIASLFTVFVFQGILMWIVSFPIQVAMFSPTPRHLTALDFAGAIVWFVGFAFEAIGDVQLTLFRNDPSNEGKVMDRGLWRYTRHPNYFGDALVWWGFGVIALATGGRLWALVGPLLMTFLLLRVSGVPLLERRMRRTRPDYADYKARTSSFLPLPPRS